MNDFCINSKQDEIISDLPAEKQLFIRKHSLLLTEKMIWVTIKENSFPRKICRHQFMVNNDLTGLLFRFNEICFAKVKYFRENLSLFEPYIFDFRNGFIKTDLWDAEFFKHIKSGYMIDLRYLNKIKEIDEFRKFCLYIENNISGDSDNSGMLLAEGVTE